MITLPIVYLQSKIFPEKTLVPMEVPGPGLAEFDIITKVHVSDNGPEKKLCKNRKCRTVFYRDSRKSNGLQVGPHDKCIDCMIEESLSQDCITDYC